MAHDDTVTVVQGNTVVIRVLANDYDPDGDTLSVQNVRRAKGVVHILDDDSLSYRPTPRFTGEDKFRYTINDGNRGRANAFVIVFVTEAQANTAPDLAVTTDEDTTVTFNVIPTVSDDDDDKGMWRGKSYGKKKGTWYFKKKGVWYGKGKGVWYGKGKGKWYGEDDDGNITLTGLTQPSNGTATDNGDGTVTYTPNPDFNGSDEFTYTLSFADNEGRGRGRGRGNEGDDEVRSATGTIYITVNPVNDAPVADNLTVYTDEDVSVAITLTASDVDEGDVLTFKVVNGPSSGSLSGSAPNLTYAPNANFNEEDSFTFQVSDGNLADTGTVTIIVGGLNDNPVAQDDDATTDEDVPVTVEVLANDSDPDGDSLSVKSVSQPDSGSTEINADDGTVIYTPKADFNGSDSFTYIVSDNKGGEATASVSVTVTPVNDAPVTVADFATVNEGDSVLINVLANDYDVDHDLFWLQRSVTGANGVVKFYDDSTLIYRPVPNFSGDDVFNYYIEGNHGEKVKGTVTVTVTDLNFAPVAYDAAFDTQEEVALSDTLPAFDADGDDLTYSIVDQGTKGSVVITEATINEFTYTPDPDANGQDSFTFRVYDGAAYSNEATVTINIEPVNDAPVFTSSPVTSATEGVAYVYDITADDPDAGANLTIGASTKPEWLTLTDGGDGTATLTGTPDNVDVGDHAVTLTLNDGVVGTPVTQSFTVIVSNVNDAPVFTSSPVTSATEGVAYVYDITADDDDAGAILTIGAPDKPEWLTLTDGGDGTATLTGTPGNVDVGDHAVTLTLTDGVIDTPVTQSFTVTVSNVNDDPVAQDDLAATSDGEPVTIPVLANDDDVDDDNLSITSVTTAAHGTTYISGDAIVYTPADDFSGADVFDYTISDGQGGNASATVTVLVDLGDETVDVEVGPEGGEVTSVSGTSINIPAGALDDTVTIIIGEFAEAPEGPELAGVLYFYGPTGLQFNVPVTVTVPYDPARIPDDSTAADLVLLIYTEGDGSWTVADSSVVNVADQTVTGWITHFSGFAAGQSANQAPYSIMSLPHQQFLEDTPVDTLIDNLGDYFADRDNDHLTFGATTLDTGSVTLIISQDLQLLVVPTRDYFGSVHIEVTATDPAGASASETMLLVILPVNDAPTFLDNFAETYTIPEDSLLQIALSANDVEGDAITFIATSDTSAVATLVQDTMLWVIPTPHWFGTAHIMVSASDGQDTTHLAPVTLTVGAVNDAPSAFTLLEPANAAVIQVQPSDLGDFLTFAWDESIDPDGDQVRYAFMLTDSGTFYFEYGDTTVNEVRVPYADILAAIRGQELTSATFWWTIMAISGQDTIEASDGPYSLTIDISTLAVADPSHLPQFFMLHQNYPNPFNPVTTLKYELPAYCYALLIIYDMRGREVTKLVDGYMGAGYNKVVWNSSDASGRPVPSGIYFARLVTSEYTHIIKMSLIR